MEKLEFPLERSTVLSLWGSIMTGSGSGQILVFAMLLIAVIFMGNQGFSPISILFSIFFLLPVAIIFHLRLVRRGKILMRPYCEVTIDGNKLDYTTGFPNTMVAEQQSVELTDEHKSVKLRGEPVYGYFLEIEGPGKVRLGNWYDKTEAQVQIMAFASKLHLPFIDVTEEVSANTQESTQ